MVGPQRAQAVDGCVAVPPARLAAGAEPRLRGGRGVRLEPRGQRVHLREGGGQTCTSATVSTRNTGTRCNVSKVIRAGTAEARILCCQEQALQRQ